MKLRKCLAGREKRPALFHGWYQFGNAENGINGMAIVEFPDGTTDYFSPGYIQFVREQVKPCCHTNGILCRFMFDTITGSFAKCDGFDDTCACYIAKTDSQRSVC
jgi:hypothetical protein